MVVPPALADALHPHYPVVTAVVAVVRIAVAAAVGIAVAAVVGDGGVERSYEQPPNREEL